MTAQEETSPPLLDTGLLCLVMLSQFFERPAEAEQIRHSMGLQKAFEADDLLLAAKGLEFKARMVETGFDRLAKTPLPAIARRPDGRFFVLAKAAENKVLIQCPEAGQPEQLSRDELEEAWDGTLILLTTRAQIAGEQRKFDISWFIPAFMKYRRLFGEVLLASFFLQVFAVISPLFFQVIIDKVLVHRGLTSLDVLIIAMIAVGIFEVLIGGLRTYIFSHTTNRVDVELGARLFQHMMNLPISFFGARRVGETVARVRELDNIRNFITGSGLTLIIDLAFTVVFFAIMFYYAPTLTWIVVGSIPCYITLSIIVTPVLRKRTEEKFQRGAENNAFLTESVSGVETLKALAVEPQMQRRWEEKLAGYVSSSFKTSNLGNIASQATQGIQKLTMALTLYFGAKLVMDGDLTMGQLIAFNMLSGRVSQPILRLAQLWQDFQQMRISVERLGDILNTKQELGGGSRAALPAIKGDVSFEGVTFRYRPDGPEILKRVSLDFPAGQVVGVVGPSGSGKSTLTKLVQRLYVPESGRVLVDGTDLSMVDPAWLRRQVGVVLQENTLFNRTVRENIALSDPSLPMERIIEAAQLAGAHDFILELAEGYDTQVGERGSTLSGGQRQRIAIARALITNPRILIFDEATSALDYESEHIIQENMRSISKGRTVFVIAHRLSTVRDCDRIITIEAGEVVEDGSHNELLKTGGRYSKLWNHQAAGPRGTSTPEVKLNPVPFKGLQAEPQAGE
ncbi:type I secretion system permease/ATPase [Terasakiella sp. SH-1]|uniref:type I secretion system permease/ATPase n=1 Tax=Terasakiella sp. SH-1 TaxID=2560057 RepID=UPI001073C7D0|nr:type I secretion system permease/ATPase [Terasakiella sp. SH-1]